MRPFCTFGDDKHFVFLNQNLPKLLPNDKKAINWKINMIVIFFTNNA